MANLFDDNTKSPLSGLNISELNKVIHSLVSPPQEKFNNH